ncbi:probable mediator of RNA polymerase II transcription subunit 15c isoform X3 [Eutrema salsugineum]|uniref:probable mediator of RNA polymerase II transcription subunit 15c isoform X3 n=1 Tax=Eutrema salsugineum TaxID=72664 RepID=UPI000CED0AFD|nr:probable mediator of RNA polymerase II transcription subunit 15c isoform X3 [Eutrema salsugineum]
MEGNSNWKPNEQDGDSLANDWRSQHEPDLRKKIRNAMVVRLKKCFSNYDENQINNAAFNLEDKYYGMATSKDDYFRKIAQKVNLIEQKFRHVQSNNVQSRSSVNGTDTSHPAQFQNQGQSLPTSLPYTHTSTSQQWLPQNMQSNLNNIHVSSGLPAQVPTTVSAAQNLNIQMSEGAHSNLLPGSQRPVQGRQQLLPHQPQSSSYMLQHQVDQQLLKEKIRHGNLRPPYMQQQQSLLKQPIQQKPPHQTPLSTIHQSFPQSSALSSVPSSGPQNSQFLPRHQFQTQRVRPSHQQQMAVPSQEQKQQEQEQLIGQLMNGPHTQQNHLPSRQNNGEQQGAFRVSSSQIASFQAMAQDNNNNLQNMHQEERLSSHGNNASALPSQQQQNMPGGQSGNFNVPGSSLLCTQGQEVGQSQPMMLQQYQLQHPMQQQQQPQNRILQQHLDDTQRFQATGSLRQTQNVADQQNQPYQVQRAPPANPSTSQDSTGKTANGSCGDWQEETYQKIRALREKHLPVLITMLQKVTDKLRQIDSLPQQNKHHESIEKLRVGRASLEQVIVFLNLHRSGISEKHRDMFSLYEKAVLRFTRNQTAAWRPMQQQQGQFPPSQIHQTPSQSQSGQVHVPQSLDSDQMNLRLMSTNQNVACSSVSALTASQTAMPSSLQTRPKMEAKDENNIKQHSNISPVQSSMFQQKQFHPLPMQQQLLQREQQQQPPPTNKQLQMAKNEMSDVRMKQGVNIKAGLLQQHLSSSQRQLPKPLASPAARMSNFSPSASSPQIQNYSSPQLVDQQILPTTTQSGGSPFVAPSPVTSFAPSPVPGGPEKPISVESPVSPPNQSQTAAQEHSLFTLPSEPTAERPIDRLIKAFQSSSPQSLAESVSDISSVISLADMIAGSFHSNGGARAGLAEDLSARTKFRLQQGETNPTKRFKRSISIQPLDIASQADSYKQFSSLESEVDSTASSGSKANMIEPGCALLQEINEINGRLVETVVSICNEDVNYPNEVTSGTVVTCSYAPVALCDTFEAHYNSGHIQSQIQPLRLLVPENYPYSPILIEKSPFDASVHKYEDLSARARSRLSLCMKELSEPMSLKEIAQAWDVCARATMAEYAERHGGGTFSSKYGPWETVLRP